MSSGRPTLPVRRHLRALALLAGVFAAILALPACDLLPQTAGEWTVALVIAGVLVVGVGVMAWVTTRESKKK